MRIFGKKEKQKTEAELFPIEYFGTTAKQKKTTDKEVELFPIKTDAPKDAH